MNGLKHAAHLQIQIFDHALVCLLRAAIEVDQAAAGKPLRFRVVAGDFPGPVRRSKVQAQQKRAT